jgi:hypothetical protein
MDSSSVERAATQLESDSSMFVRGVLVVKVGVVKVGVVKVGAVNAGAAV